MDHSEDRILDIAEQIMAYLSEYPEAGDTIEGIAEWWLLKQQILNHANLVASGLELLVQGGFVFKTRLQNGRSLYRLNKDVSRKPRDRSAEPDTILKGAEGVHD